MIYGPSGSGKTHVALDIAAHVASGVKWRGCRVSSGRVVYVAAEGGNGIKNRIAAIRKQFEHLSDANMSILPTHVNLPHDPERMDLIDSLKDSPPVLVFLDTLARCSGGLDENSTKDMGILVTAADQVRERLDCALLFVHHTGKDTALGARGSSALRAAVDTEIEITESREIVVRKQRDMVPALPEYFRLDAVFLGNDQDGDAVNAGITLEAEKKQPPKKRLKGTEQEALNALQDAIDARGVRKQPPDFPDCKVVNMEHWKEQCRKRGLLDAEKEATNRTRFSRMKDALINGGYARVFEDFAWLCT